MMNVDIEPYAGPDLDTVASVSLSSWRSTGLPVSELVSFDELRSRLAIEVERGWSVSSPSWRPRSSASSPCTTIR